MTGHSRLYEALGVSTAVDRALSLPGAPDDARVTEHRVMIERAIGVLMEREQVDAVTAFQRLRATARNSRRRAAEIAQEILDGTQA